MGLFKKSVDVRQPISRSDLQTAISEAVKQSGPECQAFIDVIIENASATSQSGANWAIRGVKFGTCDRQKASEALTVVVARMALEFRVFDDSAKGVVARR